MTNHVNRRPGWLVVTLLGLLLWGAGPAFAGYDARVSELRDILAREQLTDQKERDVLAGALDGYLRGRQQCLEDLVRIIEETSKDRIEQERAWDDRLGGCKQDASRLGDAIKSISGTPSIAAFHFVNVTAVEEQKFFEGLERVQVCERRDHLIVNQKNVVDLTQRLDEKWRALFDQDNSIDDHEQQVVTQIGEIIDRSFDQADRERRTIKEKLVDGVDQATKIVKKYNKPIVYLLGALTGADLETLKQAIDVIKGSEPAIDAYAKIYLKTNEDYIARSIEYAALLQGERGGIYLLFGGFRQDTEEFLKKNGFDQAKLEYQAGSDAMASWASGTATSGQRSDAGAFGHDVLGKLSNHLAETETKFNDFVSHHKSKFFGPIAPDIKEALAETRAWESWDRLIQGKGLDARLRQWRSEANIFFTVSLSGLSSEDQQYLRGLLQPRVDELVRSLDDAAQIPEKFHHDFDRSRLGDDLK